MVRSGSRIVGFGRFDTLLACRRKEEEEGTRTFVL